jgi:hypothetical protein
VLIPDQNYVPFDQVQFISSIRMAQTRTPEQIVQENLDFYNKRDIDGFMTSFSNEIALYTFPEAKPATVGLEAVREIVQRII